VIGFTFLTLCADMGNTNCDKCGHDKSMCSCQRYVAQEGGDHYQTEYQHWDWVTDIGMGYLPGNATKYVARWRKKNGLADLKKAMTYIDKMIAIRAVDSIAVFNHPIGNGYKLAKCTERFVAVNQLGDKERSICEALSYKCDDTMLRVARDTLASLVLAATLAQARGATTLPGAPAKPATGQPAGAGGVPQGRGAGATSSTSMEHPFGYDD